MYKDFKIGDYVMAGHIGGNQRNISYDKKYLILNVYKSDYFNKILITNDAGVKKWFNDRSYQTFFKQTDWELQPIKLGPDYDFIFEAKQDGEFKIYLQAGDRIIRPK